MRTRRKNACPVANSSYPKYEQVNDHSMGKHKHDCKPFISGSSMHVYFIFQQLWPAFPLHLPPETVSVMYLARASRRLVLTARRFASCMVCVVVYMRVRHSSLCGISKEAASGLDSASLVLIHDEFSKFDCTEYIFEISHKVLGKVLKYLLRP